MAEGKKVEELCQLLELNDDETCVQWMKKAVEHCSKIIADPETQDSNLWTAMRTAFGSGGIGGSSGSAGPIKDQIVAGVKSSSGDVPPDELSLEECSNLFKNIADDYFQKWPCFSSYLEIVTTETFMYGVVLLAVVLGGFFVFSYFLFKNKRNKNCVCGVMEAICKSTMANGGSSALTPRKAHNDGGTHSQSTPRTDNDDLSCVSNSKTIIVRINRERGGEPLENGYHEYNFKDIDQELPYQRATLEKIMDFVEDYSKSLRVVILIDDDKVYQELFNPAIEYEPKKREQPFNLKYTRSVSALSSSSSGMIRSRIPVSNLRKSP